MVGAPKSLEAIVSIAMELLGSPAYLARRAVSESIALLCRLEGEAFTNSILKSLEKKLDAKLDAEVAQSAAFMLGAIFRYVGTARMNSAHFPFTIAILQLLSRETSEPFRLWILHALWLALDGTAKATALYGGGGGSGSGSGSGGGGDATAHVGTVLSILSSHSLHDIALRNPTVTQCITRCINAVCVIGCAHSYIMCVRVPTPLRVRGSPIRCVVLCCVFSSIDQLMSVMAPELAKLNLSGASGTSGGGGSAAAGASSNSSVQRFITLWHHVRV